MKTAEAIRMLQKVLQGGRPLDEQFLCSLNCLEKQLETLKRKSPLFEMISFSEEIERLTEQVVMAAAH